MKFKTFNIPAIIILFLISSLIFIFYISPKNSNDSLPEEELKANPDSNKHPYGNPINGPLMWENNKRFLQLKEKLQVKVRMAAFETKLPDPLPGEEENVALAANYLAGSVVRPGNVFSLNKAIGPLSKTRGYQEGPTYRGSKVVQNIGGGVCKIATTLYNVAILSNMEISERYAHSMTVPYVPAGQDATISNTANKDFKFKNTTDGPVLIWADTRGSTLYMAIYGNSSPPEIKWNHQISNRVKFKTIYQDNPELDDGQSKVVIPGADGLTVHSWLSIKYENGQKEEKDLGIDHYSPMARIIEVNKK